MDISFKVQGNRGGLDRLRSELANRRWRIGFDLSDGYGPNDKGVPAEDILERELGVAQAGLTLLSAEPRMIDIRLDRRIIVPDVPVEFVYTGAKLAAPAIVKPPRMAIRVAESRWQKVRKEVNPKLRTKLVDLQKVETEGPIAVEIVPTIEAPNGPVTIEPEQGTVEVTVQISQPTDQKTITVTVGWLAPVTWPEEIWKEYSFVRKDPLEWRKEIIVRGPKTDLQQLDEKSVEAYVVLREDDKKPVSWLTRKVQIRFPPNLRLQVVGETPTVSFRLEPRTGPGGT